MPQRIDALNGRIRHAAERRLQSDQFAEGGGEVRIEPPPSVPMPIGPSPAATAAPAPLLLPPGVRSVFHGLRRDAEDAVVRDALPTELGRVGFSEKNRPRDATAPSTGALSAAMLFSKSFEPNVARTPLVGSLIETGTPCRRAELVATQDGGLGIVRRVQRRVGRHGAEGIEARFQPLDPIEHRPHDLDRRDLLCADRRGQLDGRQVTKFFAFMVSVRRASTVSREKVRPAPA